MIINIVTLSPMISVLGEASETTWRLVNMVIVKLLLRFTSIVHESHIFSFKKEPVYPSHLLVINNTFLVTSVTSQVAILDDALAGLKVFFLALGAVVRPGVNF